MMIIVLRLPVPSLYLMDMIMRWQTSEAVFLELSEFRGSRPPRM